MSDNDPFSKWMSDQGLGGYISAHWSPTADPDDGKDVSCEGRTFGDLLRGLEQRGTLRFDLGWGGPPGPRLFRWSTSIGAWVDCGHPSEWRAKLSPDDVWEKRCTEWAARQVADSAPKG